MGMIEDIKKPDTQPARLPETNKPAVATPTAVDDDAPMAPKKMIQVPSDSDAANTSAPGEIRADDTLLTSPGKFSLKRKRYNTVKITILMHIAWRNLTAKKLRSFLTVFGVIIGIGAIFFLLSFGLGLQNLVTKEVIGDSSVKSIDVTSSNSKIVKLDDTALNQITAFPYVETVGRLHTFPGSLQYGGGEIDSVVYGVDDNYQKLASLNLVAGELLKEDGDLDKNSILINKSALDATGIGSADISAAVGKTIKVTIPLQDVAQDVSQISQDFTIRGVIDSGSGTEVFLHGYIFESLGVNMFKQFKIVASDQSQVPQLRKQIESNGFETSSPADTITEINQIFKFFNVILISFGAIGMIVSILGMFNTMTISLLERTKEIGLMIALGGRRTDMRKLFIFEAVLISVIGALAGILLATVLGEVINFVMNQFAKRRGLTQTFDLFSTPLWAVMLLTGFMALIGLLVVYFPARRAQRINPIDALRRE
jgi:putative ABC transport system permease protein